MELYYRSLYFPHNLKVFFLKLNGCVNLYYGTNSGNTALNGKTFINLSRMGIWLWFLSEEVLWSVRISGAQYCSQYVSDSSSRFFTFKQNKRILIFIISSWTISYRTSAEVKIPLVIHPGDIYRPYSRSDLLNQMLYKLQKDRSCTLESLIIQSAVFFWGQSECWKYLWYNIINDSVSFLDFVFYSTLHIIFLFTTMILVSNFRSKLLLQINLCYKCHWAIFLQLY